jgi:hypothetical protein
VLYGLLRNNTALITDYLSDVSAAIEELIVDDTIFEKAKFKVLEGYFSGLACHPDQVDIAHQVWEIIEIFKEYYFSAGIIKKDSARQMLALVLHIGQELQSSLRETLRSFDWIDIRQWLRSTVVAIIPLVYGDDGVMQVVRSKLVLTMLGYCRHNSLLVRTSRRVHGFP